MIFDKMCGVVERHFPRLQKTMREAALFHFPMKSTDLRPSTPPEDIKFLEENFFLPFRTVAIEDDVTCTILQDLEPEQRGVGTMRRYIDCTPVTEKAALSSRETLTETDAEKEEAAAAVRKTVELLGESYVLAFGKGAIQHMQETSHWIDGLPDGLMIVSEKEGVGIMNPTEGPRAQWFREAAARNFATALEEMWTMNTPHRFLVEVERSTPHRRPSSPKIPRSHDRPTYVFLAKPELGRLLHHQTDDESDRTSPMAHWRRRHYRTFHSERYVHAKGRTIVVPACWVGPTEKVVGNKRYKVRIDL